MDCRDRVRRRPVTTGVRDRRATLPLCHWKEVAMIFDAIERQFSKDVKVEVLDPPGGAFNRWDRQLRVHARVTALRDVSFSRVRVRLIREHH